MRRSVTMIIILGWIVFPLAAVAAVPEGVTALKAPALRLEQREVALSVLVPKSLDSEWSWLCEVAAQQFAEATGYRLALARAVQVVISAGLGILGVTPLNEIK